MVEGLQIGNTALKKINEMLDIANIEQILDETREGIEKQDVSILKVGFLTFFSLSNYWTYFNK